MTMHVEKKKTEKEKQKEIEEQRKKKEEDAKRQYYEWLDKKVRKKSWSSCLYQKHSLLIPLFIH